ncbi:hypothetical protein PIB30_018965 [Stylosanthes scabra]|uniref:Uncharacterized protein n=1 Tax=Stylosanthes scabra TaxID=79078 RepID=A0ABU6Z4N8_9FABA|nr:hypothetical protein [Stylosanthes scabra]
MPDPSAGHELMRRLSSRTRRLLGINPNEDPVTILQRENDRIDSEKQMIIQKPQGSYPSITTFAQAGKYPRPCLTQQSIDTNLSTSGSQNR